MKLVLDASRAVRILRGLQWLMGLCALWLTLEAIILSRPVPTLDFSSDHASLPTNQPPPSADLSMVKMEDVWARPLRQLLHDPKPGEIVANKAPQPPPPVTLPYLVATFVEQGNAWALFVDQKGGQRVRCVLQDIDDFNIKAITPGVVDLTKGEKEFQVRIAEKKSEGGARRQPRSRP